MSQIADKRRRILAAEIAENWNSVNALSKSSRVTEGTLRAFLSGNTKDMRTSTYQKLATAMNKPLTYLLGEDAGLPIIRKPSSITDPALLNSGPVDVPVIRVALSGSKGEFEMKVGETIGHVRRPVTMLDNKLLFAIYMPDDSMRPMYHAGDLLQIDPTRPSGRDRAVLVELHPKNEGEDPRGLVGILVFQSERAVEIRQLNPDQTFSVDMNLVKGVHRILALTDAVPG